MPKHILPTEEMFLLLLFFWHYEGNFCHVQVEFGITSICSLWGRRCPADQQQWACMHVCVCAAEQARTLCADVSAVSWALCFAEEEQLSSLGILQHLCIFVVCLWLCTTVSAYGRETFSHITALIYDLLRSFPTGCVVFIWEHTISCTVVSASVTCSKQPDCDTSCHTLSVTYSAQSHAVLVCITWCAFS